MQRIRLIRSAFDSVEAGTTGVAPPSGSAPPPRAQRNDQRSMNAGPSRAVSGRAGVRPGNREILIVVMGDIGSGKSHFCRAATGVDHIALGGGPESHKVEPARVRRLKPHDAAAFNEKAVALRNTYTYGLKFSGILYFHRISDIPAECPPITSAQLQVFHELCRDDPGMLENVILATNRWDLVGSEEAGTRRQVESALKLIKLVIRNTPLPLTETSSRRFVEAAINNLRREQKQTLAKIVEEMQLLKGESGHSRRNIYELHQQQKVMRADYGEVLALPREERKLREEERKLREKELERMGNEIAGLKAKVEELELEREQRLRDRERADAI